MVGRKSSLLVPFKQIKHYKVPSAVAHCAKKKCDQVPPRVPLKLVKFDAVLYRVPGKLGQKKKKKGLDLFYHKCIATFRVLVPQHMQQVPSAPQQPLSASAENMD